MRKKLAIIEDNSEVKHHLLDIKNGEYSVFFVKMLKDYKNIKKGRIYFYKMVGQRNTDYQHFYLIKGRWVHSGFVTKVSDKEMLSLTRKLKIKKLLNENKI